MTSGVSNFGIVVTAAAFVAGIIGEKALLSRPGEGEGDLVFD